MQGVLKSLDGLSKEFAAEYEKGEDGLFYLKAEGYVLKSKFESKLETSNQNNAKLAKELEALRAEASTKVDKKEVERLQGLLDDIENGKGGEKFQKALERQIAAYKATAEEGLKTAREAAVKEKQRADSAEEGLRSFRIKQAVQAAASEVGLKGKSAPIYLDTVVKDFDLIGDKVVPVKISKGDDGREVRTPLMGDDFEPLKLSSYIAKQHKVGERGLDVFFDSGSGGGAPGGTKPNGTGGNVIRLTRQQAMDVTQYRAAKAAAEKSGGTVEIEPPSNTGI